MANYSTNEFKAGLKILIDGDPYAIVENEMVKPGKGQAFNRVRVRNLKTGRTIERTWKSGSSFSPKATSRRTSALSSVLAIAWTSTSGQWKRTSSSTRIPCFSRIRS